LRGLGRLDPTPVALLPFRPFIDLVLNRQKKDFDAAEQFPVLVEPLL
jgi:hypothetical protein